MVITKILEGVLVAGQTSISFTDSDISNSLIRTYSSDDDLYPVSRTIAGNTLTITYEAQNTNKGIAVEIVKEGLDIVDNVTSTDTNKALSANQGKVLKDAIDSIIIPTVPESIGDLDDVDLTGIENDDVLVYDSATEKFIPGSVSSGNRTETVIYNNSVEITANLEITLSENYSSFDEIIFAFRHSATIDAVIKYITIPVSQILTSIYQFTEEMVVGASTAYFFTVYFGFNASNKITFSEIYKGANGLGYIDKVIGIKY